MIGDHFKLLDPTVLLVQQHNSTLFNFTTGELPYQKRWRIVDHGIRSSLHAIVPSSHPPGWLKSFQDLKVWSNLLKPVGQFEKTHTQTHNPPYTKHSNIVQYNSQHPTKKKQDLCALTFILLFPFYSIPKKRLGTQNSADSTEIQPKLPSSPPVCA